MTVETLGPNLLQPSDVTLPEAEGVSMPLIAERDPALMHDVEAVRDAQYFIQETLGQTAYKNLHPKLASKEEIDETMAKVESGNLGMKYVAGWPLQMVGGVRLSSEYRPDTTPEQIETEAGFVDEDSFAFVWEVMDSVSEVDEATPAIEEKAERMLAQFKYFTKDKANYDKVAADPRLRGLLSLNAAVELAQVRDFESALAELEHIPQPRLRNRFIKLLQEAIQTDKTSISPEESEKNLDSFARQTGSPIPPEGAKINTRIVSNRSVRTLKNMFDPFSDGRVYAAVRDLDSRLGESSGRTPSSGDNFSRLRAEQTLGHERRLFSPRIVYGALVEEGKVAEKSDNAWHYGDVRFVLKAESHSAQEATYTYGDTLNGQSFDEDRILLKPEADKASQMLGQKGSAQIEFGSVDHYIEAQFDGLHISEVEAIIIRPGVQKPDEANELLKTAEVAALHGIEVTYIIDWAQIKKRNQRFGPQEISTALRKRLQELKALGSHVHIKIDIPDEDDARLFGDLDPNIASVA